MVFGDCRLFSRSAAFALSALFFGAAFGQDVVGPHGNLHHFDRLEDRPVWPEQYEVRAVLGNVTSLQSGPTAIIELNEQSYSLKMEMRCIN